MVTRKKLYRYQKAIVFLAANGKCHLCGEKITDRTWHVDHVFPLWNGGTDDYENMRPAHVNCHSRKTRREGAERAKIRRIGKAKKPSRPIPGSKRSGFKARMTGKGTQWERR